MACLFVTRNIETSSSIQFSPSYHHHSYLTWWKHGVTLICAKPNLTQPVTVNLWQSQDLKRARICEECHIFRNSFTLFPCDLLNLTAKYMEQKCAWRMWERFCLHYRAWAVDFGFTTEHYQSFCNEAKTCPTFFVHSFVHISCGQVGQSSQGNRVNEFLKMWPVIVTNPLQLATGKSMYLLISK